MFFKLHLRTATYLLPLPQPVPYLIPFFSKTLFKNIASDLPKHPEHNSTMAPITVVDN